MSPTLSAEVAGLISTLEPLLNAQAQRLCELLQQNLGAQLYVKTIYVGAELDGVMAAAIYPLGDHIEVALALPEDYPNPLLEDATHLTWRTLPVLLTVRDEETAEICATLLGEACDRVREGRHGVNRAPDFFVGRSRRLTSDPRKRSPGRGA